MEDIIKNVNQWMTTLPPLAIFLIILILIFFTVFGKTLNSKLSSLDISSFFPFKKKKKKQLKSLINNDIFNTIDRVRSITKHTTFENHGKIDNNKSLMFQDFMTFKLDAVENQFRSFLENIQEDINVDALKSDIFNLANNIVEEYISNTKEHFYGKGIGHEDCEYIVDLFEKWRFETIDSVAYRVNSIFASTSHTGKFEKLLGSLEAFSIAIHLIPKDGIASFEEMNGRFKDLNYSK